MDKDYTQLLEQDFPDEMDIIQASREAGQTDEQIYNYLDLLL